MKKKRMKKSTKIALAVIALVIVVGVFLGSSLISDKNYVPYKDFLEMVDAGEVSDITITGDKVEFHWKDSWFAYNTENPETETFKETMLLKGMEVSTGMSSVEVESLVTMGIMLLMVVGMMFMILGNSGDGEHYNSARKTGVTFDDVVGLEDIKKEMKVTIDILKNMDKYREAGVRIPKGVVLEGEPGNGKTLLAKAIAGEAGINFISANAADFGGIIVGKGSNQVKKLFRDGRQNKPCIIFIDEFDSVAEKRHTDGTAASTDDSKTLTAFLNELDGFKNNNEGIFLIVATNRPEVIDEAMIRPGRFDKRYYVTNPSYEERMQLIGHYTKNKKLSEDVDRKQLAWEFSGYSCAMIEMLINEAGILAVNRGSDIVEKQDLDESVSKYIMRGGSSTKRLSEEKKKTVAFHEAGHAVIGSVLGEEKISKISIVPSKSGMGGFTITYDEEDITIPTIRELENKVKMLYAGRAAEYILANESLEEITTGAVNDVSHATKIIVHIATMRNSGALLDLSLFGQSGEETALEQSEKEAGRLWEETVDAVRKNWEKISEVAAFLQEHEVMDERDFEGIMNRL